MTAELVIMNKAAIALAADSAVTIPMELGHSKVFNTANKVFSLSKHAPVGIMISGGALIMGVPWETIIKIYRDKLKSKKFPLIDDYCQNFFEFLNGFEFGDTAERNHITQIANFVFGSLRQQQEAWLEEETKRGGEIRDEDAINNLKQLIDEQCLPLQQKAENLGILDQEAITKLYNKHKDDLDNCIAEVFEKRKESLTDKEIASLQYAAIHVASYWGYESEIVFAGFGEEEHFPRCRSFSVYGVIGGITIRRNSQSHDIRSDDHAAILPFAQSDEISMFIVGIAPHLRKELEQDFQTVFGENGYLADKLHDEIVKSLQLDDDSGAIIKERIGRVCQLAFERAVARIPTEQQRRYSQPILHTTGFLNKDELARMAETLVNLESFRKQVGMDAETVGGPIDVAVITKGDGFIWIKRKHYFRPDLNHHFFRNYFEYSDTQPNTKGVLNDRDSE